MVKKFAALACSAVVAFGLMSCHTNDIGNGSAAGVTENFEVTSDLKTLVVKLSRALKDGESLTYIGDYKVNGTTYTFENVVDPGQTLNGILILSGGNLIDQSATIAFDKTDDVIAIELDVLENPKDYDWTTYVTGDDASAKDELDGVEGAEAKVTVKANSVGSVQGNTKFSIKLYTPAVSPLKEIKEGAAEAALMAAKCRPLNATFADPVSFEANLPGAEGCVVVCYNVNDNSTNWPVSETKLTAELSKFTSNDPLISLKYEITSIEEVKESIKDGSGTIPAGTNVISYPKKYGYEPVTTATGVIARLFRQLFGTAAGETTKSLTIKVEGETNYVLYQHAKIVTIKSGTAEFKVKIYDEVTADFISVETPTEPEIVPTHNGGSND